MTPGNSSLTSCLSFFFLPSISVQLTMNIRSNNQDASPDLRHQLVEITADRVSMSSPQLRSSFKFSIQFFGCLLYVAVAGRLLFSSSLVTIPNHVVLHFRSLYNVVSFCLSFSPSTSFLILSVLNTPNILEASAHFCCQAAYCHQPHESTNNLNGTSLELQKLIYIECFTVHFDN
jgi:hypothetical protein